MPAPQVYGSSRLFSSLDICLYKTFPHVTLNSFLRRAFSETHMKKKILAVSLLTTISFVEICMRNFSLHAGLQGHSALP